jgi:hypothetical protein
MVDAIVNTKTGEIKTQIGSKIRFVFYPISLYQRLIAEAIPTSSACFPIIMG